jgi:predicted ester cyclase
MMGPSLSEQRKRVVAQWIDDVFNAKDLNAVDHLKTSAYLDWTPFPGQRHDLPISGLKESLPHFLASFPDFHFNADHLVAEDEFVVSIGNWHGTHKATFMGIRPTNERMTGTRIDIFRVVNEKMIEHWGCGAELSFLHLLNPAVVGTDGAAATDRPDKICQHFLEAVINRRNIAAIPMLVAIDAIEHAGGAVMLSQILKAFPDYRLEIESTSSDGQSVEVTSRYSATHQGNLFDQPATGRKVSGSRTDRFVVANGKITESWLDWDLKHVREQITH